MKKNTGKEDCSKDCSSCSRFDDCRNATITLTLDNDETLECSILTIYEAGGREYIALLPLGENGENEDGEVYLYRFRLEDGVPALENILEDDEYEIASDGFDEWISNMELDEIVDQEEADTW